jgi:hypothetical protein
MAALTMLTPLDIRITGWPESVPSTISRSLIFSFWPWVMTAAIASHSGA